MNKLKIFYLDTCPYCRKAKDAIKELRLENPSFENVKIEWIEETIHPEIADQYDYYRVPSIFLDDKKLYECNPKDDYEEIKKQIEQVLKLSLN